MHHITKNKSKLESRILRSVINIAKNAPFILIIPKKFKNFKRMYKFITVETQMRVGMVFFFNATSLLSHTYELAKITFEIGY